MPIGLYHENLATVRHSTIQARADGNLPGSQANQLAQKKRGGGVGGIKTAEAGDTAGDAGDAEDTGGVDGNAGKLTLLNLGRSGSGESESGESEKSSGLHFGGGGCSDDLK